MREPFKDLALKYVQNLGSLIEAKRRASAALIEVSQIQEQLSHLREKLREHVGHNQPHKAAKLGGGGMLTVEHKAPPETPVVHVYDTEGNEVRP